LAPTEWIFIKFRKSVEKIQASLKSGSNNWYFTWTLTYSYDNISLKCPRMRNVSKESRRENLNTYVFV
jgi:hypothetical protein